MLQQLVSQDLIFVKDVAPAHEVIIDDGTHTGGGGTEEVKSNPPSLPSSKTSPSSPVAAAPPATLVCADAAALAARACSNFRFRSCSACATGERGYSTYQHLTRNAYLAWASRLILCSLTPIKSSLYSHYIKKNSMGSLEQGIYWAVFLGGIYTPYGPEFLDNFETQRSDICFWDSFLHKIHNRIYQTSGHNPSYICC